MDLKKLLHPWWLLPISLLLQLSNAKPQVPCYFIFGDSLSDDGNNNNLNTKAKVNYPPYGIDFPGGPTGRFSNGRNVQDVIVEFLGFEEPMPPFAISKESTIFHGVNYASGSAGILNDTGKQMGGRVPMNTQLRNHKTIIGRISRILRNQSSANELLSHCIYSIQIGSNDYLNNFYKSNFYHSKQRYTLSEFTNMIFQQYSQQVQALFDMGARLFALHGLGQLGCTPASVMWFGSTRGSPCVDTLNNAAVLFNKRLEQLVKELNQKHKDARFTYLNTSPAPVAAASSIVKDKPCCQIGGGGGELCMPNSVPCSNRKNYLFWDGAHLTEASNVMIASGFFGKGLPSECRPFNIPQLAKQLQVMK